MAISFNQISSSIRSPLVYIEVDNTQANNFTQDLRALLVGQRLSTGSVAAETPVLVSSVDQAIENFGAGSQLARMFTAYKANDSFTETWAIALDDDASAAAATGSATVTGTATASGTVYLYVAGERVTAGVNTGDTATNVGDAIAAAINSDTSLPVTASATTGVVTITAKNAGEAANSIDLRLNFLGELGGERTPAGLSVAIAAMSGGTTNPDVSLATAAMGDEPYEYICSPYTDSSSLNDWRDSMAGRWNALKQLYGHVFSARAGTVSELDTFGSARNDEHMSVMGFYDSPTQPEQWAAALCAQAAFSLTNDPARPLQTLALTGVQLPPDASRFTLSERNTLLFSGVSTPFYSGGQARIERCITQYQTNAFSQPDSSYLDVTTMSTLSRISREISSRISSKFPRHKLADDGTRFGAGQSIVTPRIIRSELIALYDRLENLGIVENADAFAESLIVERNATDPNRIDVLHTPDLVNQFRIFAARIEFRLQFN